MRLSFLTGLTKFIWWRELIKHLWDPPVWNEATCKAHLVLYKLYHSKSWGTERSELSLCWKLHIGIRESNSWRTDELVKITLQDNTQPLAVPQPRKQRLSVETKLPLKRYINWNSIKVFYGVPTGWRWVNGLLEHWIFNDMLQRPQPLNNYTVDMQHVL